MTRFARASGSWSALRSSGRSAASLSAIQAVARRAGRGTIPEELAADKITLARPYLGAAAALGVYAVLVAGLLQVEIARDDGLAVLAFAFASGFTERLVLRAVEAVGSR